MDKHTLKILQCDIARFLKHVWKFYNIMHERVKALENHRLFYNFRDFTALERMVLMAKVQ